MLEGAFPMIGRVSMHCFLLRYTEARRTLWSRCWAMFYRLLSIQKGVSPELDSHTGKCVARSNALFVSDKGCQITVHPFNGVHYPIQENSIAPVANMWTYPENGQTLHPYSPWGSVWWGLSHVILLTPNFIMQMMSKSRCTWPVWRQVFAFYYPTAMLRIPFPWMASCPCAWVVNSCCMDITDVLWSLLWSICQKGGDLCLQHVCCWNVVGNWSYVECIKVGFCGWIAVFDGCLLHWSGGWLSRGPFCGCLHYGSW